MEEPRPSEEERWVSLQSPTDKLKETADHRVGQHECDHCIDSTKFVDRKLKVLEEEQELLNSSLCALTTHFAQVQFRLRQAVVSSHADKEGLLKSLEEFAFQGIPHLDVLRERIDGESFTETVWLRRAQEQQLLQKLKSQLLDLEEYVQKCRVPEEVLVNQTNILHELKLRINVELEEQMHYQITASNTNRQADVTLEESLKKKEHLVTQLKTQVEDLERFIYYLQSNAKNQMSTCRCGCAFNAVHKSNKIDLMGLIKRISALLHMFTVIYFDCGHRQHGMTKKSNLNHWGDLRAKLEMAISKVLEAVEDNQNHKPLHGENYSNDIESFAVQNLRVTAAVRKHLVICIRDLMQHGAYEKTQIHKLVPFFGCFNRRLKKSDAPVHAWKIILQYYHLKSGDKFNSTPSRKLSQSFKLDIIEACGRSPTHTMLIAIGDIISMHSSYNQSYDSHFKAFICASLNAKKLVTWLSLIFQCRTLVEMHYHSWSYAVKTGFFDSLQSLDALTHIKFDLPLDFEFRRFESIDNVFI